MAFITSISGIRGTIGNKEGKDMTPSDFIKFTSAFAVWVKSVSGKNRPKIIVGRDARISGPMVSSLVCGTLMGCGVDIVDLGLTTTPTTELAVTHHQADGGIILTASHNPKQWNALKLLNSLGEFISEKDGEEIKQLALKKEKRWVDFQDLGNITSDENAIRRHIEQILSLPLVDVPAIRKARLSVVVDAVNSTGGIAIPELLKALGVDQVHLLNCIPDGNFAHDPEPLPENISEICSLVVKKNADVGFVVDPDVDRLAIVNQLGEPLGEEYTLVAVADYVLRHGKGTTVSNLSSTQALKLVTEKHGGKHFVSAVGEVNVVECMKKNKAVIGGEGNGGVIYPAIHYGRDALVGIALFLSYMARSGKDCSVLRDQYPSFFISKNKITLDSGIKPDEILKQLARRYKNLQISLIDGLKLHFEGEWVHIRKSNTEAILRVYAESNMQEKADNLAKKIISDVEEIIRER